MRRGGGEGRGIGEAAFRVASLYGPFEQVGVPAAQKAQAPKRPVVEMRGVKLSTRRQNADAPARGGSAGRQQYRIVETPTAPDQKGRNPRGFSSELQPSRGGQTERTLHLAHHGAQARMAQRFFHHGGDVAAASGQDQAARG